MRTIIETQDGSHSIMAEEFGVSYHSKYGAVQETEHVFINAGLRHQASSKKELSILGIGFGTGLNALMTCLEAEKMGLTIHYTAVEAYPIPPELAEQLNYAELINVEKTGNIFRQLHQCDWEIPINIEPHFILTKRKQTFQDIADLDAYDIIYFDAFAPNAQPELWEAPIMQTMYDALKAGGVMTTYCAKGVVKRTMKAVGFTIEALPGPPGKREMTRAVKKITD